MEGMNFFVAVNNVVIIGIIYSNKFSFPQYQHLS